MLAVPTIPVLPVMPPMPPMPHVESAEPDLENDYHFLYYPFVKETIVAAENLSSPTNPLTLFLAWPFFAPLLFPNVSSDARDHCANERTFLSWLRLAVYMAVVAVAILVNFHLKHQPTALELRISFPLGIIFFFLALVCLVNGLANYMKTVTKYARRQALVQSGYKTQTTSMIVATSIVASCAIFLAADALAET